MSLKVTDGALKELRKVKEEQKLEDFVVRVGVAGGGCSGFSYALEFDEEEKVDKDKDTVFEFGDIRVVVDKKSMLYLDGTILDWHEDLNKRGFVFDNPNAVKSCGCNKSFSV